MRGLALLLLLVTSLGSCIAGDQIETPEGRVIEWILSKGGVVNGWSVGSECPTCLRGVVATRDFEEDDVILRIPLSCVLYLPDLGFGKYSADYARPLLENMHKDSSFNDTWGLFWSAHPGPDEVLSPELWTDELMDMLQTPELEAPARWQRQHAEQVYWGTVEGAGDRPFPEVVPEGRVSLDTFKHVAALLGTRTWGAEGGGLRMIPVVDMLNHDENHNVMVADEGEEVLLKAVQPIKAGQAMVLNYQWSVIHRPDMSLYIYGFVVDREEPLLASVDLPNFDSHHMFERTPWDDSMYDDPEGEYISQEEYDRLAARLAAMPTSLEEDQALLDSGSITDWRQQVVLRYRILRKRALQRILDKIAAALETRATLAAAHTGALLQPGQAGAAACHGQHCLDAAGAAAVQ